MNSKSYKTLTRKKGEYYNYQKPIYWDVEIVCYPNESEDPLTKIMEIIFGRNIEKNKSENHLGRILKEILKNKKQQEERNQKLSHLEKIINPPNREDLIQLPNYSSSRLKDLTDYGYFEEDETNSAEVIYVNPTELPSGDGWKALGMYDPNSHKIYIANNLPHDIKRFVYYHEVAHAKGASGTRHGEMMADEYAASKVGYNPFPNRLSGNPFYN